MIISETVTTALVALSRANVPPDVQALLVYGNPGMGVAPGALEKAIQAILLSNRETGR